MSMPDPFLAGSGLPLRDKLISALAVLVDDAVHSFLLHDEEYAASVERAVQVLTGELGITINTPPAEIEQLLREAL